MAKRKLFLIETSVFVAVFLLSLLIFSFVVQPVQHKKNTAFTLSKEKSLHYVAIGDSLTEGVGDSTKQGGFVPIVANLLEQENSHLKVTTQNFGVSGNTSTQIIDRIKKQAEIQQAVKQSDVLTITVGGNDVLKVIRENLQNLSLETFEQPRKTYQSQVMKLLSELRDLNTKAPIYVLGVYNPYYINFSEIKEMQEIIDQYNNATKEVVDSFPESYFIPINQVLYKGTGQSDNDSENDVLFTEDKFHPNDTGYQLMAKEVFKKMNQTKEIWLKK